MRLPLPKGRALWGAAIYGFLQFGFKIAFVNLSLKTIPPGKFTVILATAPLFTFVFAMLHRQEKFQWRMLIGGLIALAGITLVFRTQITAASPFLPLAAVILATTGFAESAVYFKTIPNGHPFTTNAAGMVVGASILLVASVVFKEPVTIPRMANTWLAMAYLIVLGAVVVFALNLYVLSHWTASAANYQLVLTSVVAILVSSWLTKEAITGSTVIGGVLVLVGVLIGALLPANVITRVFKHSRRD